MAKAAAGQGTMEVNIREARLPDADICSSMLRASIRRLCTADHGDDEQLVRRWTANKTPDDLRRGIQEVGSTLYIAETPQAAVAVGGVSEAAVITLNYVSPAFRFLGVSRRMLERLEHALLDQGARQATLTSTETARRFYLSAGWQDAGDPETWLGMKGYPMNKLLSA